MKFSLRLLTLICFFFPFTFFFATCNIPFDLRFAYNQKEADKNITEQPVETVGNPDTAQEAPPVADSIIGNIATEATSTSKIAADTLTKKESYSERILMKIIMPTNKSLSGIGSVVYFKNLCGQVAIAICILIALIMLVAFRFLKSKLSLYLLLTSLLSLLIVIVDSFVSHVTLLWGAWLLLALILIQLMLEYRNKPQTK